MSLPQVLAKTVGRLVRGGVRLTAAGLERGPHITRYQMYRRLAKLRRVASPDAHVLSISHSEDLCRRVGLAGAEIVPADYPEVSLLDLPFEDDTFDWVVSDQVLEHIEGEPQRAVDESRRVLKPGGIALHTTCLINPVHGAPHDYWRFTPHGLRLLCEDFSEIVEADGWGNPFVWLVTGLGMRGDGIPEAAWHPLHRIATHDDPRWPVSTWVAARK